uniref:Putative methyl-CpG-binding domain-containing protein 13 isoform X1 n=1 Tax=Davidia involucrata TaxID=16924 RepID=A0A5B7ANX5_DAVIN
MVAGKLPDWLPAGWTVQVKVENGRKIKYYSNGETGQKFHSKNDVIRYVKTGHVRTPRPINKHNKRHSKNKPMPLAVKTNEFPEWLPNEWIIEVKTRKSGSQSGRKYKCYIDPATGCKLYSKPEVSQYLKTVKRNGCTSKQKKIGIGSASNNYTDQLIRGKSSLKPELSQNLNTVKGKSFTSKQKKISIGKHSVNNVMVERVTPDGLPPGWIKEIKIQKKVNGIRKDPYYTDPVSGYIFCSKKDALRYLETGDINICATKPKKRGVNDVELMNEEISNYTDQSTGGKSSLKPELSQNLKTVKGKSSTSKEKKVVVERVTPDGLPPGWIKEIRIQKKVTGTRKDPFYTDPESGYIFRSKKDALRYLETGDISSCAIKPMKRSVDMESINNELSPQSVGKGHKLEHHTSRRRLFAGKESCDTSSLVASDAEGSKEGQRKAVSADVTGTSTPTDEILEGKHLLDNVIGDSAETKEGPDPSSSALPKTKGSKRKRGKSVLAEDGPVSTPATNILQEEKLPVRTEELSNRKTQIGLSKCKKKRALIFPSRSSKRLAGLNPELVANLGLSERALRAATRKSGESEVKPSLGSTLDGVADGALQRLEAEPETEIAHHASGGTEAPSDVEPSSKNEKRLGDQAVPEEQPGRQESEKKDDENPDPSDVEPSNKNEKPLGDQAVPEEQPGKHETEKKDDENPESQLFSSFGDSWSDPCLEFAFKTLTGAIPVEDNLAIEGYFQQQVDNSHTRDGCSALPDFGLPSSFQSDISVHFDAPEKPVCLPQLPENPTCPPSSGNVSIPSCSGIGPQQPSLDVNKEYQAKVN